jgi:nucleoside-diphosphate-sugar epimerase
MHKIFNEWQAQDYIDKYGLSITGVRPANVTGPDKVRGSVDHVQCITQPAAGKSITFKYKDYMRCPIHVDDISEVFVQVLMADGPQHNVYNSGGEAISLGALADLVREFIPEAQITFENETGGKATSGNYLIDNRRLLSEFEVEYAPFRQRVMEIINDIRRAEGMPLVQG